MTEQLNNIRDIAKQLKDTLEADVAIVDKYGFVISSYIDDFKEGKVISPTLLNFFMTREKVANEMNTSEINSILLFSTSTKANLIFTFGKQLILMSKLPKHVDIDEYLPSINRFLEMMDKDTFESIKVETIKIEVDKDINQMNVNLDNEGKKREGKYKMFKEIVKKMSEL